MSDNLLSTRHAGLVEPNSKALYVSDLFQKFVRVSLAKGRSRVGYEGIAPEDVKVNADSFLKKSLLSNGESNAKTKKNWRRSRIMYLVPADGSGTNMCPHANPGCMFGCLATAGRGAFKNVIIARMKRTNFYKQFQQIFFGMLTRDIISFASSRPRKLTYPIMDEVAIRLNGTSDMPFLLWLNKYRAVPGGPTYLEQIKAAVPGATKKIIFYDYTKNPKLAGVHNIGGFQYYVTFSHAEDYVDAATGKVVDNQAETLKQMEKGNLIAVMFKEKPKYWHDHKVLDGDDRDDLMIDAYRNKGKFAEILGLKVKGRGAKDASGDFLVECGKNLDSCYSWGRTKK